jgi:hypothetical protein
LGGEHPQEGSGSQRGATTDDATWHRIFAASAFNQAWDQIEKPKRTGDEDAAMLMATFASRYHWEVVGTEENKVVGDWQIAHVASLLGLAPVAMRFARTALDRAVEQGFEGWLLASCHEGMARAHACSGNDAERDRHIRTASRLLDDVDDPGEKNLVESQLASVPGYSAVFPDLDSTFTDEDRAFPDHD